MKVPHFYPCTVMRVVDGDTLDLVVDVGFYMSGAFRFRLMGYNAPESRGPERRLGNTATEDLVARVWQAKEMHVRSHKADSFGRWLGDLYMDGVDLVPELIQGGFGVVWDGKGKRPGFDPNGPYPL